MTSDRLKKIVILAALAALAALFFGLGLHRHLTLSALKEGQAGFAALYAGRPATVLAGFFLFYVAVVALNLPGATVLGLAAGALFGLGVGTVLVSFASTIGATLACALSRTLFRDWVRARLGDRLARVERGVAEEGAFYLFTLRLIPVVPFFAINLLMGLTPMRLATFAWVSQVGMLPGTMVYVNAGSEIGRLDSLAGILSPGLLASFAILGLFPLAVKKVVAWARRRRGLSDKVQG